MPVIEVAHKLDGCERTEDVMVNEDVTFETLTLSEKTLKGLKKCGFKKPSPIQLRAIPLGRCGFDLIVEAKSGTGKTAVFGIIALEMIINSAGLQVLILAPTREIASQIGYVLKSIGSFYEELGIEIVMGGTNIAHDIERLKTKKYQILVGSPGRVLHLIKKNIISTKSIRLFVLDEADKLMEESFQKDINYIYSNLPSTKQLIAASATYTEELRTFLHRYMQNPSHVCPNISNILIGVTQQYVIVPTHESTIRQNKIKFDKTLELLSKISFKQCLIFCKYQSRAQNICDMLCQEGWPAEFLAGCQNQKERLISLEKLQTFSCRILVATDLVARGIDATNVNLVINIDPPDDYATYLHRIGRAGRYGSKAIAIIILSEKEKCTFDNLFNTLGESPLTPFEVDQTITNDQSNTIVSKVIYESCLPISDGIINENSNTLLSLMTDLQRPKMNIDKFETIFKNCDNIANDTSLTMPDIRLSDTNTNLIKYLASNYENILNDEPKHVLKSIEKTQGDFMNNSETNIPTELKKKVPKKTYKRNIEIEPVNNNANVSCKNKQSNKDFKKKVYENNTFSNNNFNIEQTLPCDDYNIWRRQLNTITSQIQHAVYIETMLKRFS